MPTEQEKTLKATESLLKQNHKAVIIRPTGFGKTWILTELIKHYNKVLYLYPSAVIRDTVVNRYYGSMLDDDKNKYIDEDGNILDKETIETFKSMSKIEKCTLMTYAKLIRLTKQDFDKMDYDLVLCDECHKMGGYQTQIASEKLFKKLGKTANFVGATATPTRSDNFDVASHFFADNLVYTYTLYDAIEDGLVKKPNYCYATYDIETDLKNAAFDAGEDPNNPTVREVINANIIELSRIYNMPNIIKEICDKYTKTTSYMKFIVFFASRKHMVDKINDVIDWFKTAYPDHEISTLKISSTNKTEQRNVEKLDELTPKKNHIDLIACVDMLNMGYHVNDQTGIIMYRGTSSNTVFTQQLGRALSAGANNSAIVFDIVDNLHRKAVFEMKKSEKRKNNKTKKQNKVLTKYFISEEDRATLVFQTNDGEIVESQYHLNENNDIVDENEKPSTMIYDMDTGKIYNTSGYIDRDINTITRDCINAVGHEATYKEIIAKAMAEPLTQRCRYALELHFRSWCYKHHVEYPISKEKLTKMYELNKNDFYKEFLNIVKSNNLSYPLQDAEVLLSMGTDTDDEIPLRICAKQRNVSVAQILDIIGLE